MKDEMDSKLILLLVISAFLVLHSGIAGAHEYINTSADCKGCNVIRGVWSISGIPDAFYQVVGVNVK